MEIDFQAPPAAHRFDQSSREFDFFFACRPHTPIKSAFRLQILQTSERVVRHCVEGVFHAKLVFGALFVCKQRSADLLHVKPGIFFFFRENRFETGSSMPLEHTPCLSLVGPGKGDAVISRSPSPPAKGPSRWERISYIFPLIFWASSMETVLLREID